MVLGQGELYRSVQFSIKKEQILKNAQRFRGGLVFKAHRLSHHSTLGLRVINKEKKKNVQGLSFMN